MANTAKSIYEKLRQKQDKTRKASLKKVWRYLPCVYKKECSIRRCLVMPTTDNVRVCERQGDRNNPSRNIFT